MNKLDDSRLTFLLEEALGGELKRDIKECEKADSPVLSEEADLRIRNLLLETAESLRKSDETKTITAHEEKRNKLTRQIGRSLKWVAMLVLVVGAIAIVSITPVRAGLLDAVSVVIPRDDMDVMSVYNLSSAEADVVCRIMGKRNIYDVTVADIKKVHTITIAGEQARNSESASHLILPEFKEDRKSGGFLFDGKYVLYSDGGFGNELSALRIFKNLTALSITYAPDLTNVSFIRELEDLRHLKLMLTNVRDLTCLESLKKLEILDVEHTPTEKIKLAKDTKLQLFRVNDGYIGDTEFLVNLDPKLSHLEIRRNNKVLVRFGVISRFKELSSIYLEAPHLGSRYLKYVFPSYFLKSILVAGDKIDLNDLLKFKHLNEVLIENAGIVDMSPLEQMPHVNQVVLYRVYYANTKNFSQGATRRVIADKKRVTFDWFEYSEP